MIKSVVLDICKHPSPSTQTIYLRQGERASITLDITIQEDGELFNLAEYEARLMAALPSGKVVIDPCIKTGANTLTYTLPAAFALEKGTVSLAYIAIYKGEEWLASTDCMTFQIKPGVDLSAEEAKSILSEFERLKAQLDSIIESAGKQKENQQAEWEAQMDAQKADYEKKESVRAANEEARKTAEAARVTAETARAKAEAERASAESARASAESTRISNENARKTAEANRVSSENTRVSQENARNTAEATRASAEKTRIAAEKNRSSAEESRISAESARVAAEAKREENVAAAIESLRTATSITNAEIDNLWEK